MPARSRRRRGREGAAAARPRRLALPAPVLLFLPSMSVRTRSLFPLRHIAALRELTHATFNELQRELTEAELAERIPGAEVAVTSWRSPPFSQAVVARADCLRLILHSAGTVKPYVSAAVFDRGIMVANANSAMSRVTAEAALALMMLGSWEARSWISAMERGRWKDDDTLVPGLQGKRIGIIGYGAITRALLPLLRPLEGVRLCVASRHMSPQEAADLGVHRAGLDELLADSEIICVQTSLTAESRHLLDRRRLALIRDGALLVNIGRGELIDQGALIAELATGRFRAALDVYEEEPLDPRSPLRRMGNVVCLPHLGAATAYCREAMGGEVLDNLRDYVAGREPRSRLTREQALRMSAH